jgi:GNAT superfamily N-acetyltransferase
VRLAADAEIGPDERHGAATVEAARALELNGRDAHLPIARCEQLAAVRGAGEPELDDRARRQHRVPSEEGLPLEVLPDYQTHGIGSALIRRLVERLDGLYMIDLSCDASLEPFYERLGFNVLDRAMGQRRHDVLG